MSAPKILNLFGKMGGNQWDALRASHLLALKKPLSSVLVPRVRIELTATSSSGICSTTELPRHSPIILLYTNTKSAFFQYKRYLNLCYPHRYPQKPNPFVILNLYTLLGVRRVYPQLSTHAKRQGISHTAKTIREKL